MSTSIIAFYANASFRGRHYNIGVLHSSLLIRIGSFSSVTQVYQQTNTASETDQAIVHRVGERERDRKLSIATMVKVGLSTRHDIICIVVLLASVVSAHSLLAPKNESAPAVDDSELTWHEDFLRMPASGTFYNIQRLLHRKIVFRRFLFESIIRTN